MTAIFGIVRFDGDEPGDEARRLGAALARFGPDGTTTFASGQAFLGRHLWALTPEDANGYRIGAEPGRRFVVAADVRLTERQSLVDQLDLADGDSLSDAALVAFALERWDDAAFERIYGCFAIAAWDMRRHRLMLARDHLGLRPLLYHADARRVAFASMPEGLHALDDVPRDVDPDTMRRHLRLLQPAGSRTAFRDLHRVRPGHLMICENGRVEQRRYWNPDLRPLQLADHAAYVAALDTRLEAAVQASLRGAGATVGCHLSSGYDSTAVTVTAARLMADRDGRVVAFTGVPRAGFEGYATRTAIGDEYPIAAGTAAMYDNIDHVAVPPWPRLDDYLEPTLAAYGSPILNMCNMAWFEAINEEARRRGVTVLLEGVMGNATISDTGLDALPRLLRAGRLGRWLSVVAGLARSGRLDAVRGVWRSVSPFLPAGVRTALLRVSKRAGPDGHRASALRRTDWTAVDADAAADNRDLSYLDRSFTDQDAGSLPVEQSRAMAMNVDNGLFLKGVLARWGIDLRDPTADRRLAEFSLRVPVEHLVWRGEPRAMLRAVLRRRVPAAMLDDERHGYQGADWAHGMPATADELHAVIDRIERFGATDALIDVARLRTLADAWPAVLADRRTGETGVIMDYRLAMVRAFAAAAFMRQTARSNA